MSSTALAIHDPQAFSDPPGFPTGPRVCSACGKMREKRRFSEGCSTCKTCQSRTAKGRMLQRLRAALGKLATNQIVAAARGDRLDVPRISQIGATMFDLMGGVDEFCRKWKDQLDAAILRMPGSKTVLDEFRAITRLTQLSAASIDGAMTPSNLSDEDLENEIEGRLAGIVQRQSLLVGDLSGNVADESDEGDEDFDDEGVSDDDSDAE